MSLPQKSYSSFCWGAREREGTSGQSVDHERSPILLSEKPTACARLSAAWPKHAVEGEDSGFGGGHTARSGGAKCQLLAEKPSAVVSVLVELHARIQTFLSGGQGPKTDSHPHRGRGAARPTCSHCGVRG